MKETLVGEPDKTPPEFPSSAEELREMDTLYSGAMRAVCAKLENLSHEFEMKEARNPICQIKHRLKKPSSIRNKMLSRNLNLDYDVMREEITDIAGVRVICSYINDIYSIADMLMKQDDVITVRVKDYIKKPKPNGYRSYHIIVGVTIFLSDEKQTIPVEIQMRTIAMDFWASLEHQLRYKSTVNFPNSLRERLTKIADNMYHADLEMQQIYGEIFSFNAACVQKSKK